jgi:molybdate transport system regulatory protein
MPRMTRMGKGRLQSKHSTNQREMASSLQMYPGTSNPQKGASYLPMAETQVSIRIDLESGGRIGPGKIALLEAIRKTGSITAAAQSMQMSYRRAWLLVDELNKLLSEPVVTTAAGGTMGGGTTVTPVGEKTIALYHSIETAARSGVQALRK